MPNHNFLMDDQRTFIARLTIVEVAFPYYSPYSILVVYIFQRVFCQLFQLKQFFFSTETRFAKVCQIPKVGKTEERWKKFGFFSTWLQIYFSQLHLHTKYLTIVFVFARKKKRLSSRDRQTQAKSSFPSLPFNFPFRKKKAHKLFVQRNSKNEMVRIRYQKPCSCIL